MNQSHVTANSNTDGVDRRGFLECMAWAGTGLLWSVAGGVPLSRALGAPSGNAKGSFHFVQISDSHIGFKKEPNKDVIGTLEQTVARINALPARPSLLLHTGDLTHLAKPEEFDTVAEVLKGVKCDRQVFVPGEHDVFTDDARLYLERFGRGTRGSGWQSFDLQGVHFVGLVNVMNLQGGGLGAVGAEQLAWLKRDLDTLGESTPIVISAHVPLWTVYPEWGWGTEDGRQVLDLVRRFGSVTVLNGHIHQVMQKVEGNVLFHTARSTAFPQPAPGTAPSPGPMKNVPAEKLRSMLGLTSVRYVERRGPLAVTDSTLDGVAG